ncbi:GNAT family N-acetyltransferase [Natrarchaeobaculum aegyptiacum]|uniref:GNAT family N-acetyltransferase n=1 Tax=Natrarchaeobaculum aegyptiacum TaxID=745377 RepID=A0A2Z2HRC7_9EURY|nr:GNAT family N-acetyltransferase [Natrarchaeobaculum aegyptiacum]ARS89716.1 GNAT family N-acetyltransferase [Natrarchaeobaculum aegyptiacum]
MFVRTATPDDTLEVRRIVDGAMLEPGPVEDRIANGDVLVAGDRRGSSVETPPVERILGTAVLEPRDHGAHVDAVAVRRRHRGRGIGSALIEAALERKGRLTAHFDADVRPFYDALGFEIEPLGEGRYRGVASRPETGGETRR